MYLMNTNHFSLWNPRQTALVSLFVLLVSSVTPHKTVIYWHLPVIVNNVLWKHISSSCFSSKINYCQHSNRFLYVKWRPQEKDDASMCRVPSPHEWSPNTSQSLHQSSALPRWPAFSQLCQVDHPNIKCQADLTNQPVIHQSGESIQVFPPFFFFCLRARLADSKSQGGNTLKCWVHFVPK